MLASEESWLLQIMTKLPHACLMLLIDFTLNFAKSNFVYPVFIFTILTFLVKILLPTATVGLDHILE